MTSFIIVAKDTAEQEKIASEICDQHTIDTFDRTLVTPEKESSIGIELMKKLQTKVFLKPRKSLDKAVIIPHAELLTIPAQNSLLKLLEEPPEHTLLFLLTDNLESLLPTIQSRCKIIRTISTHKLSLEEKQKAKEKLQQWLTQDLGAALKTAEQLAKEKEGVLQTLTTTIIIGRELLLERIAKNQPAENLPAKLELMQTTLTTLTKTNTNPRLVLEHLFLTLRA